MFNKIKLLFISPFNIFIITWISANFIYSMGLISLFEEYNSKMFLFSSIVLVSFIIGAVIYRLISNSKKKLYTLPENINEYYLKSAKFNLKVWFVLFLIEIIQQKGFPLLWLYNGDGRSYFDFGIPSYHGFLQAFYIISMNLFFYLGIKKNKKYLIMSFLHLIMPIMIISRALLLFSIVCLIFNYLFHTKFSKKILVGLLISIISFSIIFEFIGSNRNANEIKEIITENHYNMTEIQERTLFYDYFIPINIYITNGLNNINYNLKLNHKPAYVFNQAYSGLFPSVIRNIIFEPVEYSKKYGLKLAIDSYNVFTAFGPHFYDFGLFGVIFHALTYGFVSKMFRLKKVSNIYDTISTGSVFFIFLLAPFWDFLFNWFFLGIFILCYFNSKKIPKNYV